MIEKNIQSADGVAIHYQVAGNEKANSHNEVILKLLAELKDGEYKP